MVNENSKYGIPIGIKKGAGPPPGRKTSGAIDVIGGAPGSSPVPSSYGHHLPSRRPPEQGAPSGGVQGNGFQTISVLGSGTNRPPMMPPFGMPPFPPPGMEFPGIPPGGQASSFDA